MEKIPTTYLFCGTKLKTPLGKWIKKPSQLHFQYLPGTQQIQRITNNRIYVTQAHLTRTKITHFNEWIESPFK